MDLNEYMHFDSSIAVPRQAYGELMKAFAERNKVRSSETCPLVCKDGNEFLVFYGLILTNCSCITVW